MQNLNNEAILNEFINLRSDVRESLSTVPIVNKKKFAELIQPLDILVVGTPRIPGLTTTEKIIQKIGSTSLKVLQGSEYSSSKIVSLDKEYIYAYGLDRIVTEMNVEERQFSRYTLHEYLRLMINGCLVRVPNLEYEQKLKIQQYLNKQLGLKYDNSSVIKIGWNKFIKHLPFLKVDVEEPQNKRQLLNMKNGLICSTVITAAFLYGAGIKLTDNPLEVWPNDLLVSSKTQKIARIESK